MSANEFKFSRSSIERLSTIEPEIATIATMALAISPVDFGIPRTGGRRTAAQQLKIYQAGASRCDGTTKISKHQKGLAVDVCAYVNGKLSWDDYHYYGIAWAFYRVSMELGAPLIWGGMWNFRDYGHFELVSA